MLRSEAAVGGVIRLSTVTEAHVARQVGFAEAPKHPQVGLEQGEQTLRSVLVHVAPGVLFLRVIHELVHIALHRPVAAGRVRIEPTALCIAISAAFCTVLTVKSLVAWMTTAPWRLTHAIIAGRSLS